MEQMARPHPTHENQWVYMSRGQSRLSSWCLDFFQNGESRETDTRRVCFGTRNFETRNEYVCTHHHQKNAFSRFLSFEFEPKTFRRRTNGRITRTYARRSVGNKSVEIHDMRMRGHAVNAAKAARSTQNPEVEKNYNDESSLCPHHSHLSSDSLIHLRTRDSSLP